MSLRMVKRLNPQQVILFFSLAVFAFVLSACSAGGEDPAPESDVTTLIYAKLSDKDGVDRTAISRFNRTHKDVQIEVRSYSILSENGRSGIDLLLTELAVGRVPDIIELGTDGQTSLLPYRQMAEKGYLEDLWPWIENDPDLGREAVMEAPLKAAEVNGGLYAVFDSVLIHTLIGAKSVVGDRTSWTMEDMMEVFSSMPEGAVIMDNITPRSIDVIPSMKNYLLSCLMCCFIDSFVDWETGRCSFDSQQFRNCLEFVNQTPDTPEEYAWLKECTTADEINEGRVRRLMKGEAMLEGRGIFRTYHFRNYNFYFGGQAVPVGYPVEDGSVGSYFEPLGIKLAMTSTCQDKEAAWEYIRQTLLPRSGHEEDNDFDGIPVMSYLYRESMVFARRGKWAAYIGDQRYPVKTLTQEECEEFNAFFDSITRCSLFLETDLLEIVEEEASAYFAGAITLDQTVVRIQSRANLYVNEQR